MFVVVHGKLRKKERYRPKQRLERLQHTVLPFSHRVEKNVFYNIDGLTTWYLYRNRCLFLLPGVI